MPKVKAPPQTDKYVWDQFKVVKPKTKSLTYRERLAILLADREYVRDEKGQFAEMGGSGGGFTTGEHGEKIGHKKDGGEILVRPVKMSAGIQHRILNQHDPTEVTSQIVEDIPGDLDVTWKDVSWKESMTGDKREAIQMVVEREDGFRLKRTFMREADGLVVHHDAFVVPEQDQGKGLATKVMHDSFETYRQLGVDKVQTLANLDVGSYTWAKMGFKADQPHLLADMLESSMDKRTSLQSLTSGERKDMLRLITQHRTDPKLPWHIANAVTARGRKVGKELLLAQSWQGTLSMRDPESTQQLETYVAKGKK